MAFHPHRLGPGSLKFGETGTPIEFAAQLRECSIEPDVKADDPIPVLSGDEYDGETNESYKLTGKVIQGYDLNAFAVWCHVNRNTRVPFTFRPDNGRALGARGTVLVRAIGFGGKVKEYNESDFEFTGVDFYDLMDYTTEATPTPITTYTAAAPASPDTGDDWN